MINTAELKPGNFVRNFFTGCAWKAELFIKLHLPLLIIFAAGKHIINHLSSTIKIHGNLSIYKAVLLYPLVEEIVFRGVIQPSIKKAALIALIHFSPNQEKTKMEETAYEVSRVATALLFGSAHLFRGSIFQAVNSGLSAFFSEGVLREKLGLSAAIGSHMTNNFACIVYLSLFKIWHLGFRVSPNAKF